MYTKELEKLDKALLEAALEAKTLAEQLAGQIGTEEESWAKEEKGSSYSALSFS